MLPFKKDFSFNKIDFVHDTYDGVNVDLKYVISARMLYKSTLMQSQALEEKDLVIKNFNECPYANPHFVPMVAVEMQAQHHPNPPFVAEIILDQRKLNIDRDSLCGSIRIKDASLMTLNRV